MTTFKLGDLVATTHGAGLGRVVDVDPDDCNELLIKCSHSVRVGRDPIELVERASPLRRWAMRVTAFALMVRDCGWRYAI
jgi:hypothetical protein